MSKTKQYSPEVKERAVRMVKRYEIDAGVCDGMTTAERERIKALEREVKELRQANEILRLASAFFAQAELDRLKKK